MTQSKRGRPGPGRPAGIDSVDTRQSVIDAAILCFAQLGYGPATNSTIASQAGVTAGAVYYHFGTKNQLFEAACAEVYSWIQERAAIAVEGAWSVRGLLKAVLDVSMEINHEFPNLAGFVATAPIDARRYPELSEAFAAISKEMVDGMAAAVVRGQDAGLIPAELNPVQVARLVLAVVDGFAHASAASDPIQMDILDDLFKRLLLDGA